MVNLRLAPSAIALLLQVAVVHGTSLRRRLTDPAEDLQVGADNGDSTTLYTQEEVEKIIAETQAKAAENIGDNYDDDNVYMLLIAVCAGILVAIFTVWAYCFAAARREGRKQKQNLRKSTTRSRETSPASETSEESNDDLTLDEELHNDEAISYDSRRPISHVRLGVTGKVPPGRSNSGDASSIGQKSQGHDSVQSNNSMFSYMKGLRRAAHQLGGIQMMFHVNEKDAPPQLQMSEEKVSSCDEEGDVSLDSVDSFFEDILVSENESSVDDNEDISDDDSSVKSFEDSEDPSVYTTVKHRYEI